MLRIFIQYVFVYDLKFQFNPIQHFHLSTQNLLSQKLISFMIIIHLFKGIQEKLGIMNNGEVYAVFSYEAQQSDELSFEVNDQLIILRKGDDAEREWWWARMKETGKEGYVPRNLLGVSNGCAFIIVNGYIGQLNI